MGFIYKVTNKTNGKIYIGMTINSIEYRFNQHFRELKYELKHKSNRSYFHNALNKYGKDNFEVEMLEEVDESKLADREIYWIEKLNSTDKSVGYNLSNGGETPTMNYELRKKLSVIQTKRLKNQGEKEKALRGLSKATKKWIAICKSKRIDKICPICKSNFQVTNSTIKTTYCSNSCKDKDYKSWFDYEKVVENGKLGNEVRSRNTKQLRDEIKAYTYTWCLDNKDYVNSIKFNEITPKLKPLLDEIEDLFGIKDIRTVAQSVCKNNSKKLLLSNLKDYIKMYAEPDQN